MLDTSRRMTMNVPNGVLLCAAVIASTLWQGTEVVPEANAALPASDSKQQPAKLAPGEPGFHVAVISDLNQTYGSTRYGSAVHAAVKALAERFRPRLVLITGDMVAGQKHGVNAPAMWRGFHHAVTEPLEQSDILLAPTPGNHDASPAFAEERAEYVRQWTARRPQLEFIDGSSYPLRYSFTFQGAFFLSLDATTVGPLPGEQLRWVQEQLTKAENYELKIAFGHLPLYPIAHGREQEILRDEMLEALFIRHRVTAYISGHHHAFYPGATSNMQHVAMPCLGAGARPLIGTRTVSEQALVLLRVNSNSISSIEAFSAPDFSTQIAYSSLPPRITLGGRFLARADLLQVQPQALPSSASRTRDSEPVNARSSSIDAPGPGELGLGLE